MAGGPLYLTDAAPPFPHRHKLPPPDLPHPPPLPANAQDAGAKDGTLTSHRWLGGNSLNAAYYKFDEQSEKLVSFLKNGIDGKGVLGIDIFGLEKEQAAPASPSGDASPAAKATLIAPLGLTEYSL